MLATNSRVSVIVPVFNGEAFIERALRNLRSQSRIPDEIIVVDDGSTDSSAEIAKRFPEVTYVYQENGGPSSARNNGIGVSSGDILGFLDVDDLWPKDKIEKGLKCLLKDPAVEIVQGLIQDVDCGAFDDGSEAVSLGVLSPLYAFVNIGSMLFRRQVFSKVGLFDSSLRMNEDTDWFFRAWENNAVKRLLDHVGLYYTIREGSLTSNEDSSKAALPLLLKMHRDRVGKNENKVRKQTNLKDYFGGFPDRRERYPRNEFITLSLLQEDQSRNRKSASEEETSADFQYKLARVWQQRRLWKQALASYEKVIECDPGFARAYLQIGKVQEAMGRADVAIDDYKKALELFPNEAELHKALADAMEREGKAAEMFKYYGLERVDSREISLDADSIVCCFACRNEQVRLPFFLDYYRSKGVSRFFAIDNFSDDNSCEFLQSQDDVYLWHSSVSFNQANFGSAWFEVLLRTYCCGHWCITVDVDELLYYPDCEKLNLSEFCAELDRSKKRVFSTVLLEMYSSESIADTQYSPGDDFREICPYFDGKYYHARFENAGPYKNQTCFFGGARQRVFGESDAFCLNKVSLIKYDKDCVLAGGQHWTNLPSELISEARGCLLHFKYFSDFSFKAKEEVDRKEHYSGALQYRQYTKRLATDKYLTLFDPNKSVRFAGSRQLVELGVMKQFGEKRRSESSGNQLQIPNIEMIAETASRPLLSIMITVYNRTDHLERCLNSILAQLDDLSRIQIEVICDGGPNDNQDKIEEIVEKVAFGRATFFQSSKRMGHPFIFNLCIERARGQWVHIVHDDDWLKPGFYEEFFKGIDQESDLGAVFCRYELIDQSGKRKWVSPLERKSPGVVEDWLEKIGVYCRLAFSSMLVKREAYEALGGFSSSVGSAFDWDMWKRIAVKYPVWYNPEPLSCCGRAGDSLTDEFMLTGQQIEDSLKSIRLSESYLPSELVASISSKAREHYANYALSLAEKQISMNEYEAAFRNIRTGLKANNSEAIQRRLLYLLSKD